MSTQPGSIPLSSFKVGSSDHLISHVGPYGDRDQPQLFVQSTTYERRKLMLLDAASGKKFFFFFSFFFFFILFIFFN